MENAPSTVLVIDDKPTSALTEAVKGTRARSEALVAAMEQLKPEQAKLPNYKCDPMKTHLMTIRQPNKKVEVTACGHKTDPRYLPKHTNCPTCWTLYFLVHSYEVLAAEKLIEEFGDSSITQSYGSKYLKHCKAAIALRILTAAQAAQAPAIGIQ
jgi:hypothetical protein